MSDKTFQQMIEWWRKRDEIEGDATFLNCADEASLVLGRLRALVREWRELARELEIPVEGIPAHIRLREGGRINDCAVALELIVGSVPTG